MTASDDDLPERSPEAIKQAEYLMRRADKARGFRIIGGPKGYVTLDSTSSAYVCATGRVPLDCSDLDFREALIETLHLSSRIWWQKERK